MEMHRDEMDYQHVGLSEINGGLHFVMVYKCLKRDIMA